MVKISDSFSTVSISLPSYKDSEVIISTKIAVKDVIDVEEIKGDMKIAVNLASKMIKSWNFKDDEGNNLPVDKKYVEQLPTDDLEFVLDAIKPYIKKKQNLDKTT